MRYYKQLGVIIALLGSLLALPVNAENVSGLYEAEVPVESQDREVREMALRLALQQVLVRVTGRRSLLDAEGLDALLETAPRYVQQFRYQTRENPDGREPTDVLWVRFDQRAVERLLREQRLPVWGRTRPATLVWLAVDDRRERELLSNDMDTRARRVLEHQARLRGVPLRLPLMDLTDRSAISVSDVWGNFADNLLEASARYDAEAVLAGRVARTPSGGWYGRWTLYHNGRRQAWTASGQKLEEAIVPAIDQLADVLATQYARIGENSQSEKLRVRVSGVRGLADYNRMIGYLKDLSLVEDASVEQIQADSVDLILTSRHGRMAINQAISLGHTLKVETVSMTGSGLQTPVDQAMAAGEDEGSALLPKVRRIDLQYRLLP